MLLAHDLAQAFPLDAGEGRVARIGRVPGDEALFAVSGGPLGRVRCDSVYGNGSGRCVAVRTC